MNVTGIDGSLPVRLTQREQLALTLDPRTHHAVVGKWDHTRRAAAVAALQTLHIDFNIRAEKPTVDLASVPRVLQVVPRHRLARVRSILPASTRSCICCM
jgi:hypothetical protein